MVLHQGFFDFIMLGVVVVWREKRSEELAGALKSEVARISRGSLL